MFPQSKPLPGTPLNWAHPLTRGLVGYWPMWEGAGNGVQNIVRAQRGLLTLVTPSSTSGWTGGRAGGAALRWNGANGYVDASNVSLVSFTCAAWVNKSTFGGMSVVGQNNASATDATFFFRINNTSGFTTSTNNYQLVTVPDISAATWHHVVLVYDGAQLSFYLDGVLNVSAAATGTPQVIASKVVIGRLGDFDGQYWTGLMDGVQLWNRALPAHEMWQLYAQPYSMFEQPHHVRAWFVPAPAPKIKRLSTVSLDAVKRASHF